MGGFGGERLRILVAEDNPFNARLLLDLLSSRGHSVHVASDGRDALDLARSERFDLMLLDLHMPELDGVQVIEALREHEKKSGTRLWVIALTSSTSDEDRARCLAAGMDEFLGKPIRVASVWRAIARAVRAISE